MKNYMFSKKLDKSLKSQNKDNWLADWEIIEGPRNKSTATQHLEYIAYALLAGMPVTQVKSREKSKEKKEIILEINGHLFNLTKILDAPPDFEQLYFTPEQLDAYLVLANSHWSKCNPKSTSNLHKAEQKALSLWTNEDYFPQYQNLLHGKKYNPFIFLSVCIASHGLMKQPLSTQDCKTKMNRGEAAKQMKNRISDIKAKQLYKNSGFIASSCSAINPHMLFSSVHIEITQEDSINPIGKLISDYSEWKSTEQEVVFPPRTQFAYEKKRRFGIIPNWEARPVRSINSPYSYEHEMSSEELAEIDKEKLILLMHHCEKEIDVEKLGQMDRKKIVGMLRTVYGSLSKILKSTQKETVPTLFNKQEKKEIPSTYKKIFDLNNQLKKLSNPKTAPVEMTDLIIATRTCLEQYNELMEEAGIFLEKELHHKFNGEINKIGAMIAHLSNIYTHCNNETHSIDLSKLA